MIGERALGKRGDAAPDRPKGMGLRPPGRGDCCPKAGQDGQEYINVIESMMGYFSYG